MVRTPPGKVPQAAAQPLIVVPEGDPTTVRFSSMSIPPAKVPGPTSIVLPGVASLSAWLRVRQGCRGFVQVFAVSTPFVATLSVRGAGSDDAGPAPAKSIVAARGSAVRQPKATLNHRCRRAPC